MDGTKLCPFRKEENGDFAACYGTCCMAYYKYAPILTYAEGEAAPEYPAMCRMVGLSYPVPAACGR